MVYLENFIIELNELISSAKVLHYDNFAKKLSNSLLQTKTYWSILETFYKDKKIPLISPLLVLNKFVTDINTKAHNFNEYFSQQCPPLKSRRESFVTSE